MDRPWYFMDGETRKGPLSSEELLSALLAIQEPRLGKVWREGMLEWERAGVVQDFAGKLPPRAPGGPSSIVKNRPGPHLAGTSIPTSQARPAAPLGVAAGPRPRSKVNVVANVVAVVVLIWAALMVVANLSGADLGSIAGIIGLSALLASYALSLFLRDRRAIPLSRIVVGVFGLATLFSGLIPFMVLLWAGLLSFTFYLERNRDSFVRAQAAHGSPPSA